MVYLGAISSEASPHKDDKRSSHAIIIFGFLGAILLFILGNGLEWWYSATDHSKMTFCGGVAAPLYFLLNIAHKSVVGIASAGYTGTTTVITSTSKVLDHIATAPLK